MKPEAPRAASHRRALLAGPVLAAALLPAAYAQELPLPEPPPPPQAHGWRFTPSIKLSETYSTNAGLDADEIARKGWITTLTPGLRIERLSPRSEIFLDYRLHNIYYSDNIQPNESQNFLDALARVQLIDKFLFLEGRASITQHEISPFGGSIAPDQATASNNRVETQFFQVAPYIRGSVGPNALYQVRFAESQARSDDASLPDTRSSYLTAGIRNVSSLTATGWSVDGTAQRVKNDLNGVLEDGRARARLYVAAFPTVRLSVSEGYESTDFAGPPRVRSDMPGAGIDWVPSPRTQFSGVWERRYFGDGHNIYFSHRTPLTAWRFTSTRDVTIVSNQLAATNLRSVSSLLTDLLASAVPDPLERREAVRRRMEENFLPENSAIDSGQLTPVPLLLRELEGLVVYTGRTNTFTARVAQREERSFGTLQGPDGIDPRLNDVKRGAVDLSWAHRMSPITTLTLSARALRTTSLIDSRLETDDRTVDLVCATRLGPKSTLSVGVRRARVESTVVDSYRENAVFATYTQQL